MQFQFIAGSFTKDTKEKLNKCSLAKLNRLLKIYNIKIVNYTAATDIFLSTVNHVDENIIEKRKHYQLISRNLYHYIKQREKEIKKEETFNDNWLLGFSSFLLNNQQAEIKGLSFEKDGIIWIKNQFKSWSKNQNIYKDVPNLKFEIKK